jgi:hypothetical protein
VPNDQYRPIAGDEDLLELRLAIGGIGQHHLHVDEVTTFAAEVFTADGTDHQIAILVETAGRYNRTDQRGDAKLICSLEAAVSLLENLSHTITQAIDAGATLDGRRCRTCGCTTLNACAGGCGWAPPPPDGGDLCTRCAAALGLPNHPEPAP